MEPGLDQARAAAQDGGQAQPVTTVASLPSNKPLYQVATETYTVPTISGPVDLVARVDAAGVLHDSPIKNHDGTLSHSGRSPDGSVSASWVAGRWVAAIRAAFGAGTSWQKMSWKLPGAM